MTLRSAAVKLLCVRPKW